MQVSLAVIGSLFAALAFLTIEFRAYWAAHGFSWIRHVLGRICLGS